MKRLQIIALTLILLAPTVASADHCSAGGCGVGSRVAGRAKQAGGRVVRLAGRAGKLLPRNWGK